ncbi:MAG: alpha/beta hydrolase family protein [Solirubrobacteraceae bacterium]
MVEREPPMGDVREQGAVLGHLRRRGLRRVREAIDRVGDGGADAWHREWSAQAQALVDAGDASAAAGHPVSAREAYLRATTYLRTAYLPLLGAPIDDRLRETFARECEAFAQAAPLWDTPVEIVEIPFEGDATLPAVFVCRDDSGRSRPTIVNVNGYDSNIHEMFVAHSGAALRRGYNVLLFDGPGQGRNLIRDGLSMRPDWENVVRPVVDYALERSEVDADRIVLAGWSWGGFLALRAAAFENRIAALWADPGQWDQRDRLPLEDHEKESFPDGIDPDRFAPMENHLRSEAGDPLMRWRLLQRGLWVHGVDTLFEYLCELTRYELSPIAANITCPTLIAAADDDPIAIGAPKLHAGIGAHRKALIPFSSADGTGGHCEFEGRRRFHQVCFDWLDETLHP